MSSPSHRLLVINPNANSAMTERIAQIAAATVSPGTAVTVVNPADGVMGIEGFYDGAQAAIGLLELVKRGRDAGYDGYAIACFDDVGLDAARSLVSQPVMGTCQAAMMAASAVAHKFSVVTTVPNAVPLIEGLVARYGMAGRCVVRAANIRVNAADQGAVDATARIRDTIRRTLEIDDAEAIVLGSASMSGRSAALAEEFACPIIDGVAAAVSMLEALVRQGLGTSKLGAYATPFEKSCVRTDRFLMA